MRFRIQTDGDKFRVQNWTGDRWETVSVEFETELRATKWALQIYGPERSYEPNPKWRTI